MAQLIEINEGEVKVKFTSVTSGKVTFKDLGLSDDQLAFDGGFVRIVFDMEDIKELEYFQVPTVQVAYKENMGETHWMCDFNGETIVDKTDNHGNSTVVLINRSKLENLEQHHENTLILHAEFPEGVHILSEDSFIHFFK